MNFYCQLDYEQIPYPSPTSPNGNLANNGCGVCSAAMVVETMTGQAFPPEEAARLAKACGAREGFGTNMAIFAPVFSRAFDLQYAATGDPSLVLVCERTMRGDYLGQTILTLPMADIDARLLCRPGSEWLNTSNIISSDTPEIGEE